MNPRSLSISEELEALLSRGRAHWSTGDSGELESLSDSAIAHIHEGMVKELEQEVDEGVAGGPVAGLGDSFGLDTAHPSLPPIFSEPAAFDAVLSAETKPTLLQVPPQHYLEQQSTRKRKLQAKTDANTSPLKIRKVQKGLNANEPNPYKSQPEYIAPISVGISNIDAKLAEIRPKQRQAIMAMMASEGNQPHPAVETEAEKLAKETRELQQNIDYCLGSLQRTNETYILIPVVAYRIQQMLDQLRLLQCKLNVLKEELDQAQFLYRTGGGRAMVDLKPCAAMVITKQPFPSYIIQQKTIDSPIHVSVIPGSMVDQVKGLEPVKAELINQEYNPSTDRRGGKSGGGNSGGGLPSVSHASERLDATGTASFERLTFPRGTRVKCINMKFASKVALNGQQAHLQSDMSKPFIVMTNHGQSSMAGGRLFKKYTFNDKPEIAWPAFANSLQLHYLQVTKQDPMNPERPLSFDDLEYLHRTRFSNKSHVSQEDFNGFWEWFGTILRKISNNQKHMQDLWIKGMIYGFISRADADKLLASTQPGSFIIRFSETNAGQFVVVYKNSNGDSRHCLITEESEKRNVSLANFLRDMGSELWCLLQLVREKDTGEIDLVPKNKDELLADYYDNLSNKGPTWGYDTEIVVQTRSSDYLGYRPDGPSSSSSPPHPSSSSSHVQRGEEEEEEDEDERERDEREDDGGAEDL